MKKRVLIVLIGLIVAFILIWAINKIVKITYSNSDNVISEENEVPIQAARVITNKDTKAEFYDVTITNEETLYFEKVLQSANFKETNTNEKETFIIKTSIGDYTMSVINNEVHFFKVDNDIKKEATLDEEESNKIIKILNRFPLSYFLQYIKILQDKYLFVEILRYLSCYFILKINLDTYFFVKNKNFYNKIVEIIDNIAK